MGNKPIWKKALGLLVDFDDEEQEQKLLDSIPNTIPEKKRPGNVPADTNDLEALLAESKSALEDLGNVENIGKDLDLPESQVEEFISDENLQEGVEVDFTQIYQAVSKGENSIFDVEEILNAPELGTLPRETKAKAAVVTLRAMGSNIEDILYDAYNKDQALDATEVVKKRKVYQKKQENEETIKGIKKEIDDFLSQKNSEIEALNKENNDMDNNLKHWVEEKLKEEKRIHNIVLHFVKESESQITLGEVEVDYSPQERVSNHNSQENNIVESEV